MASEPRRLNFLSSSSFLLNRRPADLIQAGQATQALFPRVEGFIQRTLEMTQAIASPIVHDLIGVGFGPSNLALAIALQERGPSQGELDVLFLDKQADYRWHGNTLVTQSELQISFLKDLVTLRNP